MVRYGQDTGQLAVGIVVGFAAYCVLSHERSVLVADGGPRLSRLGPGKGQARGRHRRIAHLLWPSSGKYTLCTLGHSLLNKSHFLHRGRLIKI
jgi:hypothetical protein